MSDDDRQYSQPHAAPGSGDQSEPPDPEEEEEEEEEVEEEEPIEIFTRTLDERRDSGDNPVACMTAAFKTAGEDLDEDEAFTACVNDCEFTAADLAAYLMSTGKRDTKEIAATLNSFMTPTAEEWVASLLPTVEGLPARQRMERIMDAVNPREIDVEGETIDFVGPFLNDGCTPEEVVATLYDKTDLNFGELLDALPERLSPEEIGSLVKACEIDLTESDIYSDLREHDLEFEDAVCVVRAAGGDVMMALSYEEEYSRLEDENFIDVAKILVKAGYSYPDAFKAIIDHRNLSYSTGDVIEAALDPEVTGFDLNAYLAEASPDPDQLDEELREKEIDIKDRVRILHRMLFPEQYPALGAPTAAEAMIPLPTEAPIAASELTVPVTEDRTESSSDPNDWAAGV